MLSGYINHSSGAIIVNILITDDEPLARQRLERFLQDLGEKQIHQAQHGLQAIEYCQNNLVDIIFLDIRMPAMDGLETAQHLCQLPNPPAIVFVSAYDEYALKAFSVNAIDYLMKPVNSEQIHNALKKAKRMNAQVIQQLRSESNHHHRQHISTQFRGEIQLIPIKDIYYFQADQKYVNVCHKNGECLIEEPLKSLEEEFSKQFIRIHRNALINKYFISGLSKNDMGRLTIVLKECHTQLEISRRHVSEIRALVKSL